MCRGVCEKVLRSVANLCLQVFKDGLKRHNRLGHIDEHAALCAFLLDPKERPNRTFFWEEGIGRFFFETSQGTRPSPIHFEGVNCSGWVEREKGMDVATTFQMQLLTFSPMPFPS